MSKERLEQMLGSNDKVTLKLGSEQTVKRLWDASHVDKYEIREGELSRGYPINEWFGVIVRDNGIPKLVSVVGYSLQTGKNGKKFAFVGGGKTHPDFTGKGYMREARSKSLSELKGIDKIAGFSAQRRRSNIDLQKPETHDVIPDSVLDFMRGRIKTGNSIDWGIYKGWWSIIKMR